MKRVMIGLMMAVSAAGTVVAMESNAVILVGVSSGYGTECIMTALNKQEGIKAIALPRFSPEALAQCDAIIIPQKKVPLKIIRGSVALRRWVENGGGVMFTHDAVGYRLHMAVFLEIGGGINHTKLDKVRVAKKHPITAELQVGQTFSPGFQYDHVIMEQGPAGETVIDNAKDQPVVVVGAVGKGRVILNGMLTGSNGRMTDAEGGESEPAGDELKFLVNAVRWLAGGR